MDSQADVPELPEVQKPTVGAREKEKRQNLFRSRHFSSVAGLNNPITGDDGLIQKRYDLYERLRIFYTKHDPEKIKMDWAIWLHGRLRKGKKS